MKKIAVIPNITKDKELIYARKTVEYLKDKASLYMDRCYEQYGFDVTFADEEIYSFVDFAIVLGGDGTILEVAEQCAKGDVPILGINLGTIGFMSEVEPDNIESAMDKLLGDDFNVQNRMMMRVEVYKNGVCDGVYHALNDVVISKHIESRLIHYKLYSNDELVNTYTADGMIIATPTGSTAYSLSAGGPVVDPLMTLFVATPICPHMLTARPAIVSADKTVTLQLDENYRYEASVSIDGGVKAHIQYGDKAVITKSGYITKLIKISNQSFYDTLIMKLL